MTDKYLLKTADAREIYSKIKNLIERNKMTDSEINAEEITKINNAMPSIIGIIFSSDVQSLNKTEVKVNDNIQSTTTETDAKSMNQKTIDNLHPALP